MKAVPEHRIKTYTGKLVDLERPTVEAIDIRDIAHALAQINRFTGHTSRPYSVAEHSAVGSHFVAPELALEFLLHDAQEAYLGDVSSPLKGLIGPKYAELEAAWAKVIAKKFRLDESVRGEIKVVDEMMLQVELRTLFAEVTTARPAVPTSLAAAELYFHGGIVGARDAVAMVGERGPETIFPAARAEALTQASRRPQSRSVPVRDFEAETLIRERRYVTELDYLQVVRHAMGKRFADLMGDLR